VRSINLTSKQLPIPFYKFSNKMKKTIHVIDDDVNFLEMFCIRLRSEGHTLMAASDGHLWM